MPRPPKKLGEFVGQRRVCGYATRLVAGSKAKAEGEAVVSLLLLGASGMGKSSLAIAIAEERGVKLVTLLAGKDVSVSDVVDALLKLRDCDDPVLVSCSADVSCLRR